MWRDCASSDISPNYGGKFRLRHVWNRGRCSRRARAARSSNTARYVSTACFTPVFNPAAISPRLNCPAWSALSWWPTVHQTRQARENVSSHSLFYVFHVSFRLFRWPNLYTAVISNSRHFIIRLRREMTADRVDRLEIFWDTIIRDSGSFKW